MASQPPTEQTEIRRAPVERRVVHAACGNCHQRKIRCDARKRGFPCSNCISGRRANCRIHEKKKRLVTRTATNPVPIRRRSTGPSHPVPIAPEASSSSTAPDNFQQRIDPALTAINPPPPQTNQPISTPQGPPPEYSSSAAGSISTQSPRFDATDENAPGFPRHLVEFIDQEHLGKRSIQRGVRIVYVGKDVSNLNFLVRQRDGGENEEVYHFPSDELAKRHLAHEPERTPREAFMLPNRALADELVDAYFKLVNPSCPIVDEEIFLRQYRSRDTSDAPSLLVLQAILMVGAHVSRKQPERDALKATFFRRAKMLFDSRLEKNRDLVVQAALLLTWHSDGAEDICANAWHWVGIAVRTAMGLGMHRDATPSTLNAHDKRTWRRMWWIMVQFDVIVSLIYGRPQAINLDECDVQPLTQDDFEGCGPGIQADYIIKYTELCVIISKVLRERFGLRVTPEQRKLALNYADEALANWSLSLPSHLQLRYTSTDLWLADLHLTYNNFLILLHRPNPRKGMNDHGPNDSDICSAAATTITTIFEDLREHDRIKCMWISGTNALFTAMIQVSVELRFSNPVLAIAALRRLDSSLLSLKELAEYWVHAEPILRLFEESSHVQHGIRMRKPTSGLEDECSEEVRRHGDESRLFLMQQMNNQTDLDVLAAAANVARNPEATGPMAEAGPSPSDWRQIQPPPSSTENTPADSLEMGTDIMPLENEWREIYWQEPGIARFLDIDFGDTKDFQMYDQL